MTNTNNQCHFEGRITRDPQISTVQIGQDTVNKALFTIAVDRALSSAQRQKVKNGDQSIKTCDFIPCSLLGSQVDVLRQYFPVGKAIKAIGHYTEYQSTDQQTGQKKYGHIFEIETIGFVVQDSKNVQNNGGGNGGQQQQNNQQNNQNNGYQQQNNGGYQQQNQPQQPQQNNNFTMFDDSESPF